MKNILLVGGLLLATGAAHAQNNVVKVDIIRPTVNTGAFSFEHKLSESASFQLTLSYTANYKEEGSSFFGGNYQGRSTSGFGIMPEYRFYLSEKYAALQGFYVAPFVRYQYLSQTGGFSRNPYFPGGNGRYEASLNAFGGGLLVGRHWIFKRRFSLDVNLGPEYVAASVSGNGPELNQGDFLGFNNFTNYNLNGAATFGFAF